MKKVYKEFFCFPEHGNIPEKVFYTRFSLSILTIFICLVALCSVSYAWFTETSSTGVAEIKAASTYRVSVTQITEETQAVALSSDVQFSGDPYSFSCDDAGVDTYKFRITADSDYEGMASTGYCRIDISAPEGTEIITPAPFYTAQIVKGESIELNIDAALGCKITFTPQWGTSTASVQQEITTYGNGDTDTIIHSRTPEGKVLSIFDKEVALEYEASYETNLPATRVVFGSYNEYEEDLTAKGVSWENGVECGTVVDADTVRRFQVEEVNEDDTVSVTRYILATDDSILYFPEDSSELFKDLSPYVTSVELGNISLKKVTAMSAMFKDCDKLARIYVPSDWSNSQLPEGINMENMFAGCTTLKGGGGTTVHWAEEVLMKWDTEYKDATQETLYMLTEPLSEILGNTNADTLHTQLDALQNDLKYSLENINQLLRIDGGPCSVDKDGNSTAGLFTEVTQKDSNAKSNDDEKQNVQEQYGLYKVNEGDSLASIAEKFSMKEETLRNANGFSESGDVTVNKGDWLIIPRFAIGEIQEESSQESNQEQQEASGTEESTVESKSKASEPSDN